MGEAQHRARDSGVGSGHLHPVRQVCPGVPACRDPRQGVRARVARRSPAELQIIACALQRIPGRALHAPGRARGLHGLWAVCRGVPGQEQEENRLKAINMAAQAPLRDAERDNWAFFQNLPEVDRARLNLLQVKDAQLLQPLFEFSGACAGCGETPYLKLISQLFGDRALIANATGCSSIYGANLPTTPWSMNTDGRGPAWSNSLFEDNAEFGLGFRLTLDKQTQYAHELLCRLSDAIGADLAQQIMHADQSSEDGIYQQRQRVAELKTRLAAVHEPGAADLLSLADVLVKRSVWIVGGDGWAYDIGYGGLDHVLASGRNVNVLVLDTEVYSNTGGQMSKSTPRGAVAKFAAGGKQLAKKDLGLLATTYGTVYVARDRDGRQRCADAARHSRGGSLRRTVAHHRLQPLHRAWLRPALRAGTAKACRAVGSLATVPV